MREGLFFRFGKKISQKIGHGTIQGDKEYR
jgi:hypothetical protein